MATILVVEDDPGIRDLLAELLPLEGHAVRLAADGLAALAAVAREPPDLVLSDLMMPNLGGIGLRERLVRDGHRLRMVFMSATPHRAAGLGVPVVAKPFVAADLFAALAAALAAGDPSGAA